MVEAENEGSNVIRIKQLLLLKKNKYPFGYKDLLFTAKIPNFKHLL